MDRKNADLATLLASELAAQQLKVGGQDVPVTVRPPDTTELPPKALLLRFTAITLDSAGASDQHVRVYLVLMAEDPSGRPWGYYRYEGKPQSMSSWAENDWRLLREELRNATRHLATSVAGDYRAMPRTRPRGDFVNCVSKGERRWTYSVECD